MHYYNLSDEQTKFLNEYRAKDMGFTSLKEMEKIKTVLGIATVVKESELQPLRNSVVKFYSSKMESVENDVKQVMSYMDSLQSVTAVIDTMIYHYWFSNTKPFKK